MRGHNVVLVSGNIGGKVVHGKTRDQRSACSFSIASENDKHRATWIRINAYDNLAEYCQKMIDKGVYCSVEGELMNRDGQYGELTEVRAHNVIFSSFSSHTKETVIQASEDERNYDAE